LRKLPPWPVAGVMTNLGTLDCSWACWYSGRPCKTSAWSAPARAKEQHAAEPVKPPQVHDIGQIRDQQGLNSSNAEVWPQVVSAGLHSSSFVSLRFKPLLESTFDYHSPTHAVAGRCTNVARSGELDTQIGRQPVIFRWSVEASLMGFTRSRMARHGGKACADFGKAIKKIKPPGKQSRGP